MATKRLAHRAVRVVSIFGAAMMSPACEDSTAEDDFEPLPIEYVTDELEIATTFHAPLCGGDLDRFDAHVRRIDAVLGTGGTRTLYIYDNNAYPIPGCWEGVLGCFDPRHGVAMGLPVAVSHELVHAVSIDLGFLGISGTKDSPKR